MIGIIGAMDVEIEIVKNNMIDLKKHNIAGNIYYSGKISNKEVVLVRSGIGKVNASIATQILINTFDIEKIINIGIAGAVDEKLKHLDMVISDKVSYHDFDRQIMNNHFPFRDNFLADEELIEIVADLAGKMDIFYRIGTIVTGDQFISSNKYKKELQNKYQALCVEMEGCAIGHTAYVNKIPFVIIRTISDLADDSGDEDYDEFEEKAAKISAKLVLNVIEVL